MSFFWKEQTWHWLRDREFGWIPVQVTSVSRGSIRFYSPFKPSSTGDDLLFHQQDLTHDLTYPIAESVLEGLDDMSSISDLHESAILLNLQLRYKQAVIYTSIGSILCAVNPYYFIPGVYEPEQMAAYKGTRLGEKPPHIYAIANEAYAAMWRMDRNQCLLISGESGAGKTESTKFILSFLTYLSQGANSTGASAKVEAAIQQSGPVLEAFGNAKTIHNDNSSRFGKYIQLHFNQDSGNMVGGYITDYLLEKNRISKQNPGERNFHIFYEFLQGCDKEERERFQLGDGDSNDFYYLNQGGSSSKVHGKNDADDFKSVLEGLRVIHVPKSEIQDLLTVIAAILHLGNVKFFTSGGAQISNPDVLSLTANLLGVNEKDLSGALTHKFRLLRGEEISTPLSVSQAEDSRDSVSMALYSTSFRWINSKINQRISKKHHQKVLSIGVLDIFGFESFGKNHFEQFNINYANEKLQEYFNKHIFSLEQHEYSKEGIPWVDIEWQDNSECLDLIEQRLGVVSLMNEESNLPNGQDCTLAEKLHSSNEHNAFYVRPRLNMLQFGIRHYAGEVVYEIQGMVEKNRDLFREDLHKLMKSSTSEFIYERFLHYGIDHRQGGGVTKKRSFRQQVTRGAGSIRQTTVTTQFKDSLRALMTSLNAAHPYFVRCIKPNTQKLPEKFEHKTVLNQLRYSGMMETVKIRRAGYPVRRDQQVFIDRFYILARVVTGSSLKLPIEDPSSIINQLLTEYDPENKLWQIGNSKVFLKEQLENKLEAERDLAYRAYINIIASYIYTFVLRRRFLNIRRAAILLQKHMRRQIAMRRFTEMRRAAVSIQKFTRGFLARKQYLRLLRQKREEEEKRRKEEEEKERRRREELLRLEMENKKREAQLLKKQLEEEEARRVLARLEEERSTQEAIVRFHELQDKRKSRIDSNPPPELSELPPPPVAHLTPGMMGPDEMRTRGESPGYSEFSVNSSLTEEEMQRVEQEALTHILDLDACLKEEENRSDIYSASPTSSFDNENEIEERERFASIQRALGVPGTELYSMTMEGFLYLRGGRVNTWKRRWCVVRDQTFMYFKNTQDALKQGWINKRSHKKSGTLGKRTQMKRQFFVLRGSHLSYYESDEEDTKPLNTLDIRSCTTVSDEGTRNNLFSVTNVDKTYMFSADTQEEKREWMDLLRRVKYLSDEQLERLQLSVEADPRNAMGSLDLDLIDDVSATKQSNRSNSFAIIMAHRVMVLSADKQDDMHRWISVLKPSYRAINTQGLEILRKGYLIKEREGEGNLIHTLTRKKRFYVLTRDGLSYYRSEDSWLMGQIRLDSLCSLILPNEFTAREIDRWTFMLNTRKKSYLLGCVSEQDYQEWVYAINNVIFSKPVIETPTEKLINFIVQTRIPRRPHVLDEVYRIYSRILSHQNTPLKFPLLALPYGKPILLATKAREYDTLHVEAVNVFNTLLNHELLSDPIPITQSVINTCYDVEDLRSEIFCQLIKQTSSINLDSLPVLRCWQFLCCLCWCFVPDRSILKYLRIHLTRNIENNPETEIQKFAEFAIEGLNRVKPREFPPSKDEISALLGRRPMKVKVNCYSGGACDIQINSHTTAGEVVKRLCIGLGITQDNNKFALFEISRDISRFIENKAIIADVLSKHERFIEYDFDAGQCHLFFRILCTINPSAVSFNTIEFALMVEQAHENVVSGFFSASQKSLIKLAALHLQFTQGDFESGTVIKDITKEYPLHKVKEDSREHKESASLFNKNTLKGLGKDTMKRLKDTNIDEMLANEMALQSVKGQVTDFWRKLRGMSEEVALEEYMNILNEWPGFGSTFFNIQYTDIDDRLPRNMWLGLNVKGVQLYKRGESRPIVEYPYNVINNYEAIGQNYIKLHFSDKTQDIRLETSKVLEICKILNAFTAFTQSPHFGAGHFF